MESIQYTLEDVLRATQAQLARAQAECAQKEAVIAALQRHIEAKDAEAK